MDATCKLDEAFVRLNDQKRQNAMVGINTRKRELRPKLHLATMRLYPSILIKKLNASVGTRN
jgi:hypothetical protein